MKIPVYIRTGMTLIMVKKKLLLRRLRQKRLRAGTVFCCEDAAKHCAIFGLYVLEECVGLTKEETDLFICPKCVQ